MAKVSPAGLLSRKRWKERNPDKMRGYVRAYDERNREARRLAALKRYRELKGKFSNTRAAVKVEVLAHYAGNALPHCCWPGCFVNDIDMLTLDHINNDGSADRKRTNNVGGFNWYRQLKKQGFPSGYQTLCANHQLKKEISRHGQDKSTNSLFG